MECVICGGDTGYCGGCEAKTPALQDLVRALDKAEKLIAEWPAKRAQIVAAHPRDQEIGKVLIMAAVPMFLAQRAIIKIKDAGPFGDRVKAVLAARPDTAVTYKRGDWVQVTYATLKTRLALIHDRSDRSPGNYRGTVIAGTRACAEKTILAVEIIGMAPDDKRLREAKALINPRPDRFVKS